MHGLGVCQKQSALGIELLEEAQINGEIPLTYSSDWIVCLGYITGDEVVSQSISYGVLSQLVEKYAVGS